MKNRPQFEDSNQIFKVFFDGSINFIIFWIEKDSLNWTIHDSQKNSHIFLKGIKRSIHHHSGQSIFDFGMLSITIVMCLQCSEEFRWCNMIERFLLTIFINKTTESLK